MKYRFTNNTGNDVTVDVEIAVSLKYLSNFWKSLEIPITNCKIISSNCIFSDREKAFVLTDAGLYVPIVTLSTQDKTKLL